MNDLEENFINHNDSDSEDDHREIMMKKSFTSKLELLKQAHDLCKIDQKNHDELYNLLENFVIFNEINNDDNLAVIN